VSPPFSMMKHGVIGMIHTQKENFAIEKI